MMMRRLLVLFALVLGSALVAGPGLAASANAATSTLSDQVDNTYQTNGRVYAIVPVTTTDTVYIAGDFTSVRPAGAAAGSQEVPRARLAAFQISTGALLPWNPGADKSVYALAASPNGHTIYAGGNFSRIGGAAHKHMAAIDAGTGAVSSSFKVNTDYNVRAIASSTSGVYFGGHFTTVNGVPRSRVAAVDPTTGGLQTWTASADNEVRAITLSPDGSSVYLGGDFSSINGNTAQKRLAKLSTADPATLQAWSSHPGYPIHQIIVTTSAVYVGGDGSGGHAGSYSTAGVKGWVTQTDGGVQAIALLDGMLYVGGHFDNVCVGDTSGATTGFQCPSTSATRHKLLAVDPANGNLDAWNPGANSNLGVWSLAASDRLHVGGDFTKIGHAHAQQGYATFSPS